MRRKFLLGLAFAIVMQVAAAFAQQPADGSPASGAPAAATPAAGASYVVGPMDVLVINSYDQTDLSGKFTVETDGSFTYPLIGRVHVGGLTLRAAEELIEKQLMAGGFFKAPQITVSIEQYRSQKIHIVGEVRTPGTYPIAGDMRLVEVLALAGSTTPMASGEVVIVHESAKSDRVDLRELENGDLSQNVRLATGDTLFVQRSENVYVFGQGRTPGA
jgi:polysaccharide export outer membrane protein